MIDGEFGVGAREAGAGQEDKCPLIEANAKDSETVISGFGCSCRAL